MSSDERDFKLNRSAIKEEEVGETVQCLCLQYLKVHNLKVFTERIASRGGGGRCGMDRQYCCQSQCRNHYSPVNKKTKSNNDNFNVFKCIGPGKCAPKA